MKNLIPQYKLTPVYNILTYNTNLSWLQIRLIHTFHHSTVVSEGSSLEKKLSRKPLFSFAITLVQLGSHSFALKLSVNKLSADQPNCDNLAGASTQSRSQSLTFATNVFGFQKFCAWRRRTMNEKLAKLLINQVFLENDFVLKPSIETQKQIHIIHLN